MKTLTLSELQELINIAIEIHGGDKKIKCFDYRGEEIPCPQVVERQSDKGIWLEFL